MVILDESGLVVESPDFEAGRIEYHEANVRHRWVSDVEEQGHYETVAEYDNGGKDLEWVVDVEGSGHWETVYDNDEPVEHFDGFIGDDWPHDVEIQDTWSYGLYVKYSEEELAQIESDKRQSDIAELKRKLSESDYVITKISEYNVSGEQLSDDDAERYAAIIEQRAQWRAQINELEAQDGA